MALVMVADDDPTIRELLVFGREAERHEVVAAEDGDGALAAAREHAPGIAALGVHKSRMPGFDVCRMVRADAATARLPVVTRAASVREFDVAAGFDSGVEDYMAKPFNPHELFTRVQAVLTRTR